MTRSSKIVKAEIDAIRARDRAYNRVVNEGGEGYERDSVPAELRAELSAALDAEFAAAWTLDVLQARRDTWNAAVNRMGKSATLAKLADECGYTISDIARAKRLHGIK